MQIKGNDKKRGTWKIGIIQEMYQGNDQAIQALSIQT